MINKKVQKRIKRHRKVRSKISGTAVRPRVSVFKSNTSIFVQAIDDDLSITIFSAKTDPKSKNTKLEESKKVGIEFGKGLIKKGIKEVLFDRGGNYYTGRVAAVADGLRESGLKV